MGGRPRLPAALGKWDGDSALIRCCHAPRHPSEPGTARGGSPFSCSDAQLGQRRSVSWWVASGSGRWLILPRGRPQGSWSSGFMQRFPKALRKYDSWSLTRNRCGGCNTIHALLNPDSILRLDCCFFIKTSHPARSERHDTIVGLKHSYRPPVQFWSTQGSISVCRVNDAMSREY